MTPPSNKQTSWRLCLFPHVHLVSYRHHLSYEWCLYTTSSKLQPRCMQVLLDFIGATLPTQSHRPIGLRYPHVCTMIYNDLCKLFVQAFTSCEGASACSTRCNCRLALAGDGCMRVSGLHDRYSTFYTKHFKSSPR